MHTSDWHVGKLIRGASRADEHRAVLREIASIAEAESVDVVLVAGDLFETAAPGPGSEQIVYQALLDLARVAPVVVVGGNHDNPRRLAAVAPLLSLGRVHLLAQAARPDDGGVIDIDVDGTTLRLALVPFVSKRGIVRADELMRDPAFELNQTYDERMRAIITGLTSGFAADTVNVVCGHLFAAGGTMGGGERSAHTIMDYSVGSLAFPVTAQYVALGHLHRPQEIPGSTRIRYSGSPLQLDFGETGDAKSVTVVDLEPGAPAAVREVPLTEGRRLRTLTGTLAELEAARGTTGDDHLRIVVADTRRAGLADEIRSWFEHVVDVQVRLPDDIVPERNRRPDNASPSELFSLYLAERGVDDDRLVPAFEALLDEATTAGGEA
ncbi:exonuclease SbcCD subunit D [Actinospongicola halichondriae]|uniref:exonuclease SbcCD subunit D n=1 Tax=Actinospongicola halichondriae TaxID=3236844 RepID=UPI003D3FDD73